VARKKIAVCDSETDPFKYGRIPSPFVWGYYDGATFEHFATTQDFIEFASQRDEIIYAHNGGKFDFFFMSDFLDALTPLTVINGRIVRFKIGLCEFRDSYAILPVPLSAHDKGEMDYALMEAGEREKHMPAIMDYLYRDCYSLYSIVTRYIDDFGLNLTLASGAMKVFCKMAEIETPTSDAEHYETFAPFYYGGRVECFKLGIVEEKFKVADINSAYPRAMKEKHAFGTLYEQTDVLPADKQTLQKSFIRLTADSLGAFPARAKDKSLYFPNDGKPREFFVTGWEFDAARDTGALRLHAVHDVYTFYDDIDFCSYVDRFFAEKATAKLHGDKAGYLLSKLHLTSLYGKFGANPAEYEEFMTCSPSDISALAETQGYDYCDMFGPNAVLCRPISESRMHFFNVATAASITGYVRAFLWRAICACDGVLYVDTDSIAARDVSRLELGDKCGQWEIEATCDRGAIAGKKLYAFHTVAGAWPSSGDMNFGKWKQDITSRGWKVSSKGVRLDEKEIWAIAQGKTVTHAKDAPTFSLRGGTKFIARDVKMHDNAISHF
jgi:hypothetical protein